MKTSAVIIQFLAQSSFLAKSYFPPVNYSDRASYRNTCILYNYTILLIIARYHAAMRLYCPHWLRKKSDYTWLRSHRGEEDVYENLLFSQSSSILYPVLFFFSIVGLMNILWKNKQILIRVFPYLVSIFIPFSKWGICNSYFLHRGKEIFIVGIPE